MYSRTLSDGYSEKADISFTNENLNVFEKYNIVAKTQFGDMPLCFWKLRTVYQITN